jgi:iron complex outermembrane receptor protein
VKSGFIYFAPGLQPTDPGFETDIKPEKALDFELGAKNLLLSGKLQLNANLYYTRVTDYQASWTRDNPDATKIATVPTVTQWGNAEKVLARGVEVESAYQWNHNLSLSANGAYNKATYETQWLITPAAEANSKILFDARGRQLANVPKVTLSYGANYQTPLTGGLVGRFNISNSYKSSFYFNDNHSPLTKQAAYTVTNLRLAVGPEKSAWELSLLVKNLFNTDYSTSKAAWTNTAAQTKTVGDPRYYGLTFKSKF